MMNKGFAAMMGGFALLASSYGVRAADNTLVVYPNKDHAYCPGVEISVRTVGALGDLGNQAGPSFFTVRSSASPDNTIYGGGSSLRKAASEGVNSILFLIASKRLSGGRGCAIKSEAEGKGNIVVEGRTGQQASFDCSFSIQTDTERPEKNTVKARALVVCKNAG